MIIHPQNPKPIEQRVQELILKKLYIKVNDSLIFIEKETFIGLILRDVIALAVGDNDIDEAIEFRIENQPECPIVSKEYTRNELQESAVEFAVEIEAYQTYMNGMDAEQPEDEIYMDVLSVLNAEPELLQRKLHELMMEAIDLKIPKSATINIDRESLIDLYANQVRFIASTETIEEAVEFAYEEYESYNAGHLFPKKGLLKEFIRFEPIADEQIKTYKLALSMESQNAEYPMILATVRQFLNLK